MAKSLFASKPEKVPKSTVSFDEFQASSSFGRIQETLIATNQNHSMSIVPFKFDIPSPDDIVSTGLKSSRNFQKVDTISSTKASSGMKRKGKIVNILPENETESSSTVPPDHESEQAGEQSLIENLGQLKLENKSRPNNNKIKKVNPNLHYEPEKWMLVDQETKSQLNIAIVGHVDSGKSTLCGRLLHLLGRVSKKQMHKYEKESKEKGKGSFAYAWAMDSIAEERERGVTMTVALAYFESKNYRVVLLDSPGHKDFVPNMISGALQADTAILIIDSSIGAFEAGMNGFNSTGQTKEHAQIIRSFGVEQIIVAINKLDSVGYSKERFDFVKLQLSPFLRLCGFKESGITWIPLSSMENQNLVTPPADVRFSSWYEGQNLLEAIDSLTPPNRDISKPLILPICDIIASHTLGQVAVSGKLETGAMRTGSKVMVMPLGVIGTVRIIERDSSNCTRARAGDNVSIGLQGIGTDQIAPGGVICHPDFPVKLGSILEIRVLVLDINTPILIGPEVELHIHHARVSAKIEKIISLLDNKGELLASKKIPRMLTARQKAIIQVKLEREVCVEEFSICRVLGRVFLRSLGNTVAAGIVNRILD